MTLLFTWLLRVHLACAFTATAAFWVAALSPKGGSVHRAIGGWFARLVYATAVTGAVMAIAGLAAPTWGHPLPPGGPTEAWVAAEQLNRQAMWLVLYVLLIIVAPVHHGLAAVAAGPRPRSVRSRAHACLNVAAMLGTVAMLAASVVWQQWIVLTITPIGFVVGLRNLSYAGRRGATPREWEREHLTSMLTTGVTLHTALLVFGTSRSLELTLSGATQLLPWVLPALIGLPIIAWLRAHRR